MYMLNRMYSRCASGPSDGEDASCRDDLYVSELFSVRIICALGNDNREVKLEGKFILVGFLDCVCKKYNFEMEDWKADEF
jgi:hypothetical protein